MTFTRLGERLVFAGQTLQAFTTTGAVAPSGTALARALCSGLAQRPDRPIRVLEAGAGTGAVTSHIAGHLGPGDQLHLAEPNAVFARYLTRRADSDPRLTQCGADLEIFDVPVEQLPTRERYDAVVCGLPFANFTPDTARRILAALMAAVRPAGTLSLFAYRGTAALRALVGTHDAWRRHRQAAAAVDEAVRRYATMSHTVWRNLPPARVHLLMRIA